MVRPFASFVGVLLVATALACGGSPAAPASVSPTPTGAPSFPIPTPPTSFNATGTWEGQFEVTHCETNWIDTRGCAHNRRGEVRLKLTQQGDQVSGSLFLYLRPEVVDGGISVSGRTAEQTLTLGGESSRVDSRRFLEKWSATVGSDGGSVWTIQATFDVRHQQKGTCITLQWCIDPIVWRRAYSTSPMIRVGE